MMEHGGSGLFKFVKDAHAFISEGHLSHIEWEKAVKVIFKQMVEAIEFIHSKNVCHFDISLENMLISDVFVEVNRKNNLSKPSIEFMTEDIQVKLCDFGMIYTLISCKSNSVVILLIHFYIKNACTVYRIGTTIPRFRM